MVKQTLCTFSYKGLLAYSSYLSFVSPCFPHGRKVWGFWFQLKVPANCPTWYKNPNLNHILDFSITVLHQSTRIKWPIRITQPWSVRSWCTLADSIFFRKTTKIYKILPLVSAMNWCASFTTGNIVLSIVSWSFF